MYECVIFSYYYYFLNGIEWIIRLLFVYLLYK